jgi:hypothetical protein
MTAISDAIFDITCTHASYADLEETVERMCETYSPNKKFDVYGISFININGKRVDITDEESRGLLRGGLRQGGFVINVYFRFFETDPQHQSAASAEQLDSRVVMRLLESLNRRITEIEDTMKHNRADVGGHS